MHSAKKTNRGVTLLELVLAIAIILVLVFVGVRYYIIARAGYQVTRVVTNIDGIVNASYQWLKLTQGNFCGPAGESKNCSNAISMSALTTTTKLLPLEYATNPFDKGNPIQVGPEDSNPNHIKIIVSSMSAMACQTLLKKIGKKAITSKCVKATEGIHYFSGTF